MRFLIDESLGIKISHFLNQIGYDSVSVAENRSGISDEDIIKFANKEKRILVTSDQDFGDLIFR